MLRLSSNNKKSRTKLILVLSVVVTLLAAGGAYAYWKSIEPSEVVSDGSSPAPAKMSEKDAADKQAFVDQDIKNRDNGGETDDAPSDIKPSLSATQESDEVVVRTKIEDVTDGTCELTVKNAGASLKKTADVLYQSEYSTCAGFSIPNDELGKGSWQISLKVTSGTSSGTASTTVTVS